MLLQVLRNIFNVLGLGSFYQMTVTGFIIVFAILLNRSTVGSTCDALREPLL